MNKGRLEAFTDAIAAIAATIIVLELKTPFTTGWVGFAPDAALPEVMYAVSLLLWSAAFHLLDWQIRKDNPGAARDSSTRLFDRAFMYGGYAVCILLALFYARGGLYLIGVIALVMTVRIFIAKDSPMSKAE